MRIPLTLSLRLRRTGLHKGEREIKGVQGGERMKRKGEGTDEGEKKIWEK